MKSKMFGIKGKVKGKFLTVTLCNSKNFAPKHFTENLFNLIIRVSLQQVYPRLSEKKPYLDQNPWKLHFLQILVSQKSFLLLKVIFKTAEF